MVSDTPCGVAGVLVMDFRLRVRWRFWVLPQQNPGSKIQGSEDGDPKMGVFDGIISATSPHLLTRWRAQRVYVGKAVTASTFER